MMSNGGIPSWVNDLRRPNVSRREFIASATTAAVALAIAGPLASADDGVRRKVAALPAAVTEPPPIAKVVMAQDEHMIPARIVQRGLLRTYLEKVVAEVAGEKEAGAAWHRILSDDDRILIKFNQSMAVLMGTTWAMAEAIVGSLTAAGFDPAKIVLLEVEEGVRGRTRTRRPDHRWQGRIVEFGESGKDAFRADVDWATAIINVPFLKTHHQAVMTSCLKNLSHGLIRHPARFHDHGCAPAIAEINACNDLRSRVKLNIVNGLRVNFDGGPDGSEDDIANGGLILAGRDPAACDTIGFGQINRIRSERGLDPLLPGPTLPRQLVLSQSLGAGTADPERIEVQRLDS